MILETPVVPYGQWLLENLPSFVFALSVAVALGIFVGFLVSALRYGPTSALRRTWQGIAAGWRDLAESSSTRIAAIGWLAFQESIRSKVLVAFILFVGILLFAAWFPDVQTDTPQRLYLSTVLRWANYLVIALAMILSAFSLPNDLKNRTIYTVATKPVRAWEIVLGRIAGFVAIGTILIALMWVTSYVFVVRGLRHFHRVDVATSEPIDRADPSKGTRGRVTLNSYHRHQFTLDGQGQGRTDTQQDHWHEVRRVGQEDGKRYEVGPPVDMLLARIPIRGALRFLNRVGEPAEAGVSVGKEWRYRDYIEGGTGAAAIWTFQGVTTRNFPRGIPLEMTIRVFRTYVGDIERGIAGTIVLRNPHSGVESTPREFTAQEFAPQAIFIDRELKTRRPDGRTVNIDLFDDVVHDGALEVKIQCLEPSQYFGMAPADLYLRAADGWFWLNFVKGYLSIWFGMVLVVGFGVMFSTMLSGPVALLATLATVVAGFFAQFIVDVATGQAQGGGPIESMIRIAKQMNLVTPLDENLSTSVVQGFDSAVMVLMRGAAFVLPDYRGLSTRHFVAYGFDIPAVLVAQHLTVTIAYLVVLTSAGYFLFKSREIAA
jgi:ABC-type transport system involved in multi-copper enzyme maturation permease subunit